jgi:hypothetical protein
LRGTNEQTTKFRAWNVWWTGGGWWTRPVIGWKLPMLNRPEVAVPADHVERVMLEVVGRDPIRRADVDHELASLVVRRHVVRGLEVALRVRRVLEELAVVVPIALRRLDLGRRLEVQDPLG